MSTKEEKLNFLDEMRETTLSVTAFYTTAHASAALKEIKDDIVRVEEYKGYLVALQEELLKLGVLI